MEAMNPFYYDFGDKLHLYPLREIVYSNYQHTLVGHTPIEKNLVSPFLTSWIAITTWQSEYFWLALDVG